MNEKATSTWKASEGAQISRTQQNVFNYIHQQIKRNLLQNSAAFLSTKLHNVVLVCTTKRCNHCVRRLVVSLFLFLIKNQSRKKKKKKKKSIANFGYFLFTHLIKISGEFYIERAFIKMNWWKFSSGNMEKSKQFLANNIEVVPLVAVASISLHK